jgi:dihydrofolate synthase/folylpolyglutamate synthase
VDADAAIVSSIALDHCEWLGNDLESIAHWKAGIFRAGCPAIFGARTMPATIRTEAERIGARLLRLGVDFDFELGAERWSLRGYAEHPDLPYPGLPGVIQLDNAAAVLTALASIRDRLPVSREAIDSGLRNARLAGRFEVISSSASTPSEWILDVAHNPAAATTLAQNLDARPCQGKTIAVCGMFADKDADGVIAAVFEKIDAWIITEVSGGRAMRAEKLAAKVKRLGGKVIVVAADVVTACKHAQTHSAERDRIVVFGSFHAVGPALDWLRQTN